MAARKKVKGKKGVRKPKVLKVAKKQTGISNKKSDSKRKALPPGERRSKTGRKYSETRKNRSDMPGKVTGIVGADMIRVRNNLEIALADIMAKMKSARLRKKKSESDRYKKQAVRLREALRGQNRLIVDNLK